MPNKQPPRPPLWRVMDAAFRDEQLDVNMAVPHPALLRAFAAEIRAVAQWLQDNGLVSTTGTKATPGSHARLLEALEAEVRRAEAGE